MVIGSCAGFRPLVFHPFHIFACSVAGIVMGITPELNPPCLLYVFPDFLPTPFVLVHTSLNNIDLLQILKDQFFLPGQLVSYL